MTKEQVDEMLRAMRDLTEELRANRRQAQQTAYPPWVQPLVPQTWPTVPATNDAPCAHESCPGCKAGTCSGMHMLVCFCRKCQPFCLTTSTVVAP